MTVQGRGGRRAGPRLRRVARVVAWTVVAVAFALPLRYAIPATFAYADGYWSKAFQRKESGPFTWKTPERRTVQGPVVGAAELGYLDEALEQGQTQGPYRVWVDGGGTGHVDRSPPLITMTGAYGGALAVAGIAAYVVRAWRRAEGDDQR